MKLAVRRAGIILLFTTLLQACGGGDGDGGSNGPPPTARLQISQRNVTLSLTPGDAAPLETISVEVDNAPATRPIYFDATQTGEGLQYAALFETGPTTASIEIQFQSTGELPNGSYDSTIIVRACLDSACAQQVSGSPATITTSYGIGGTGTSTVTLDRIEIEAVAYRDEQTGPLESVQVKLEPRPASDFIILSGGTASAIDTVRQRTADDVTTLLDVTFRDGQQLPGGVYRDTVTLAVCYDASCIRQAQGSPFSIPVRLEVDPASERGLPHLEPASRAALSHDVIDAEFSKPLNSIVMVGSYPSNALYVYDVTTGNEKQQALNKIPTAVSIAPDGLSAAVGHDALVTIVDLTVIGQRGAPPPILLNVSSDIFDVVLDGHGYVHAFPLTDQWVDPHSIEIATNIETLGGWPLYAGSHARLHPSGDFIYSADNGLSPSDIAKWDIASGAALRLYDSPYHGDYGMCGDLWFNESGTTIYTACGNTFNSTTVAAQDMTYSGSMEMAGGWLGSFMIAHLSHSAARGEIALVEIDPRTCGSIDYDDQCYTHLAFHEDEFLNRNRVYSIRPMRVGIEDYLQRGMFVFQDAIGSTTYLLSRLAGMTNPDAEYYISAIE